MQVHAVTLDMFQSAGVGVAALLLGLLLTRKVPFLKRRCIPAPVSGGLIFSLLCMFLLLWKFAAAKVFPDCVFVVLLSWGIGISGKHLLIWLANYLSQHMK